MTPSFENTVCPNCNGDSPLRPVSGSRTDIYVKKFGLNVARSSWCFCKGCGLLFQNPRPSKAVIEAFYQQNKYFGSDPAAMDRLLRVASRKHSLKLEYALRHRRAGVPSEALAVDIGCGIGGCLQLMHKAGLKAFGIEPDPVIGSLGRKQLGIEIRTGLFGKGLLAPQSASFFYSNHVFEHLEDPQQVVGAMAEALVENGSVFTCVPTYARNSSWEAYAWQNLSHNYLFTHRTLAALFQKNGFIVDHWRYQSDANELWMVASLGKPNASQVPIPSTYDWKVYADYRFGVMARSLVLWPLRLGYHFKEVSAAITQNGWTSGLRDLGLAIRTPLADLARVFLSLGRTNRA